ncbi:MAG: alpha/beta hydrolase, partial [Spirochaetaceae bacterium]|nr:alpha/beta hydrolase [Spirochaetaceae bacterium]
TFSFQGKDIHYEVYGSGKTILLLNGILMSTLSWAEYIEPLSSGNRLILMDMLDQGQSAKMSGPYKQDIQADVVNALCEHLAVESLCVAGYSYGGKVALQFALKYPKRVERLVLFNSMAWTSPWIADIGESWNQAAKLDGKAFYLSTMPIIYSPHFYEVENKWLTDRQSWVLPVFDNPVFRAAITRLTDSGLGFDVRDRLSEITAPTLVVSGELDSLVPIAEQTLMASKISNSQHVILAGSGHGTMYEASLAFASLLYGFVNIPKVAYSHK